MPRNESRRFARPHRTSQHVHKSQIERIIQFKVLVAVQHVLHLIQDGFRTARTLSPFPNSSTMEPHVVVEAIGGEMNEDTLPIGQRVIVEELSEG